MSQLYSNTSSKSQQMEGTNMTDKELIIHLLANVWSLFVFAMITLYCKHRLEKDLRTEKRSKVFIFAFIMIACTAASYMGAWYTNEEFATIMTYIDFGASAAIFFIGFPKFWIHKKQVTLYCNLQRKGIFVFGGRCNCTFLLFVYRNLFAKRQEL